MRAFKRWIAVLAALTASALAPVAAAQERLIEESDPSITYTGTWIDVDDARLSGGSAVAAREAGARATVTFNGNAIQWLGVLCTCAAGTARVRLDGQLLETLTPSYTGAEPLARPIWTSPWLPAGQHTLEIEVTGDSGGNTPWVVVDAFRLEGSTGATDAVPPTVRLTGPDVPVTGTVTLSAEASDNVGVSRVLFMTGSTVLGEDTTPPFSFTRDVSNIREGHYSVHAEAIDTAGNVGVSPVIGVQVNHRDQVRPLVTLTAPTDGAVLTGMARFAATASDASGIRRVTFDTLQASDSQSSFATVLNAPYDVMLNTARVVDGRYPIWAQAIDNAGVFSAPAAPVYVTVDNRVTAERTRVDDADPAIVYTGDWRTVSDEGLRSGRVYHWNAARIADTPGARVRFTFTGTGVRWLGTTCFQCGAADVSIDGGAPTVVTVRGNDHLGDDTQGMSYALYTSPALPRGTHTIEITVRDYPPPVGVGMNVLVDGFEVLP